MRISRVVFVLASVLTADMAQAATYSITSSADSGAGTLRQAISDALTSADAASTITFSAGLDGATITLTGFSNDTSSGSKEFGASAFFINQPKTLTIDAAAGMTHGVTLARDTIAADYPGPPASAPKFRLFAVGAGSMLTLRGFKLSNGVAQGGGSQYGGGALGAGGGIFNQGTLIVERCTFANNQAIGGSVGLATDGAGGGGGVGISSAGDPGGGPNGGTLAVGGFGGGGGKGNAGSLNGFVGGFGGGGGGGYGTGQAGGGGFGAGSGGGFSAGSPGFGGGGSSSGYGGAGGGMGGAIFNDAAHLTLTNVTFNGNSVTGGTSHQVGGGGSGYGGAIFNYAGTLTADFITVSGSSVGAGSSAGGAAGSADGGAIYSLGDSNAACSAGGNTCAAGAATLTIHNSIVANSSGAASDVVTNMINGGSETHTSSSTLTGSVTLGALASGGGLEAVMLPPGGSAAIDAATCDATSIDQRGILRPQGSACDIGAVEVAIGPRLCYVSSAAAGANTGASWSAAYTDLQLALRDFSCTQIWVAKGVYKPTATIDQTISFNIHPGVAVYGGFAGTETLLTQRNPAANLTVLSGDVDNNDTSVNGVDVDTTHLVGSNSHHVVVMNGTTALGTIGANTILDGFTITGGQGGDVVGIFSTFGGGLYCNGAGSGKACSPTLGGLVFSGNSAFVSGTTGFGGAMFNCGESGGASSPMLSNVTFSGNSAGRGGAVYNDGTAGSSSPTLNNVTFSGNSAKLGGAMFNDGRLRGSASSASSPTLTNVTFSGNSATLRAGAMYNGADTGGTTLPTLTNVTFSGNSAGGGAGGAMYNEGDVGGNSSPILESVTFRGNSAGNGGAMYNSNALSGTSNPTLHNTILWNDTASVSGAEIASVGATIDSSVVQGGCPSGSTCTNLIAADPQLGALQNNGGLTQTLLPAAGSSAINAGDNATCAASDQRGIARPQGSACDIGAVEVRQYQLSVDVTGSGSVSSSTPAIPVGAGISNCTGSCSAVYAEATNVSLLPTPATAWHFVGWSGSCASDGTVTMNASHACTATFAIDTHAISGNLSGLAGSGLVLHLDYGTGNEDLPVAANGAFAFITAVPVGATYAISIGTQPSNLSQTCQVTQDSTGSMPDSDVTDVLVACTTNSYTVGGSVSGLTTSGLTLQLNGAHDLAIPTNATGFVFASPLVSGSSYVVSIKQQPTGRVCNVTGATGAVTSANISSVSVTCVAAVTQLSLSIDDGHTYARYGQVLDYLVTLSNSGNTTASNIDVAVSTPGTGLDLSNAQWQCIGGDSAAICTANGTGASLGKATLPAGRSLTWIVSVPVTTVTTDNGIELDAHASGATNVSDVDSLVIFRDGFNVAFADGTRAVTPAGATVVFALPSTDGKAIEAIKTLREGNAEIRVERIAIGTLQWVRLLQREPSGVEHASPWAAANANATLVFGSIEANGQRVMLLEGAQTSLLLAVN